MSAGSTLGQPVGTAACATAGLIHSTRKARTTWRDGLRNKKARVAIRWGGPNCKPKMLEHSDITGTQLVCASFLPFSGKYLKPEGEEHCDVRILLCRLFSTFVDSRKK